MKNRQLCETHTYHGKHQCLLEAVEGDAEGLQLHPAVVWVCSSCRSEPVLLTLGTVTPGEVPGVGVCWKGALEGPGALLPLCCQSSQASFYQLRSGFWWAACAGYSAAVGTACRPSPWPSCCAGGQTSQLHKPCSSCPLPLSMAASPKITCRHPSPWPSIRCRQSRICACNRPQRLSF